MGRRRAHHGPRGDDRDDGGERGNRAPAGDAAAFRTQRRPAGSAGGSLRRLGRDA